MNRTFLRSLLAILPFLAFNASGSGAPAGTTGFYTLRLHADTPTLEPAGPDGGVVPRIPRFGLSSSPGEPMLPLRVVLVAIPEGAEPALIVRSAREEPLGAIRVAPVPRPGFSGEPPGGPKAADLDFAEDRAIYGGEGLFPARPVRLGRVGYLRQQRFVEVLFTPVRYSPASRLAHLYQEVVADIEFRDPGGAARTQLGSPVPADPHFEETYRATFANYEQGRAFRVAPGRRLEAVTASSTSGTAAVPGPARYKLSVSRAGIYRLTYAWLQANAPDLLPADAPLDPQTLVVRAEGIGVPIAVLSATGDSGEADGRFDPGDVIEFYGQPKREPPTLLNFDFPTTFPDVHQANDFTDTQVYWLSAEAPAGQHPRIASVSGAPGSFPLAAGFRERGRWEENNLYLPLADADPFFSLPALLAGGGQARRDLSIPLLGLAGVTTAATVSIRLRGGSGTSADPDHRTRVWVNNDTGGGDDFTWEGDIIKERAFTAAQNRLADPSVVHVELPGLPGVETDVQWIDHIVIEYERTFVARSDLLQFSYPNQDVRFQVGGFSGAPASIYEITSGLAGFGEAQPVRIAGAAVSGAGSSTYAFQVARDSGGSAPAIRTFVAAGPGALLQPDGVARAADPVLTDSSNAADLLVIASRGNVDASPGSALGALLDHRAASQGLSSRIVYMDEIYDEFADGLRDPNAIRRFLDYAYENWTGAGSAAPPAYVLLVGDATPDYKNTLGRSDWVDQVPTPVMFNRNATIGYYSSDNWLASFRGSDQMPDVHLGRISTRSVAESEAVFAKIRAFEQMAPGGAWRGHMLLLAGDGNSAQQTGEFEALQDGLDSAYFPSPPYATPDPPLYFARPPWNSTDVSGFRAALLQELAAGVAVLGYVGHGSFENWGLETFFTAQDASALSNGPTLPFMVNINCLAGGFHFLQGGGSLAERMVNNPQGGAVAALAPAGLSTVFVGPLVAADLFGPLFDRRRERVLGPATTSLRASLWSQGFLLDLQSYTYLGDPATRIATPAPVPPSALTATGGNGEVVLTWTASPEPVAGYGVYRAASFPGARYETVDCTPLSETSCADRGARNGTTYYYHAVSRDADGFEGRASNFNSDCDTGPDCVTARPLNPEPPSPPARPSLHDAGTGGRLDVTWTANPESDVKFYTVHYGNSQGAYFGHLNVSAPATWASLTGLSNGLRYHVALTATNTSDRESAFSQESSEVPHLFLGIAPPRAITDLALTRSGADLILNWSHPLVDIYGRPTTISGYRIYKGSTPGFAPFATAPYASLAGATSTTFVDAGAGGTPAAAYFLVAAVDANGDTSGAGRELPNGIPGLILASIDAGTVRLSWTAVATDVAGRPTVIDHYEIHRMDRPLGRAALGPATLLLDNVRATSIESPVLTGATYFSVIAVDNRGNRSPF